MKMGVDDEKRRGLLDPNHTTDTEYEDEDENEEALSLCDLPVSETKGDEKQSNNNNHNSNETRPLLQQDNSEDDHFEFGSWGGPVLTESEMCAAEDVFFQGQILPLRLSISSDNCATTTTNRPDCGGNSCNPSRSNSRSSESTERCSSTGFTSSTSRSSSSRSHNSSNGGTLPATNYKPKARNLFHSHPSPKPQLWFSNSRPKKQSTRNRGSTVWGLFRPGLVQTPEIEFQSLQSYPKLRDIKGLNSSGSSVQSNCRSETKVKLGGKKKQRFGFESCRCSAEAIGTVSSRVIVRKSDKKVKVGEIREEKKQKQRKEALYHRRTFEWLKELSITDDLDGANYVSRS